MFRSYKSPLRFLAAGLLVAGLSFASIASAADINITIQADPKTTAAATNESGEKMFPLQLTVDDTVNVGYIKDRIEDKTGFPAPEQILHHPTQNDELDNGKPITGSIKNGDTLLLTMKR